MFCRQRMLCNRAVQLFAAAKRARDLCIPWNIAQPRFGLLRRDTHFPMASITASLPGQSKFAWGEEAGQQMIDVPSRSRQARKRRQQESEASCRAAGERSQPVEGGSEEAAKVSSSSLARGVVVL